MNNYFESLRSNVISSIIGQGPTNPTESNLPMSVGASGGQYDNYLSKLQNICTTAEANYAQSAAVADSYKAPVGGFNPLAARI